MDTLLQKIFAGFVSLGLLLGIGTQVSTTDTGFLGGTYQRGDIRALFETSLASRITATDTSFTLVSATDKDGTTLASSTYGFIFDEGTASEELVLADCTGTVCTNATRGVSVANGTSSVASLKFEHRRGSSVKITDAPFLLFASNVFKGTQKLENIITYNTGLTPTNAGDIVDKEYADNLAFSGIITGANFPISNTLVWFNGTNLVSTSTRPLYVDAINATSTNASSSIALALGVSTTTPHSKLTVANNGSILVTENRLSTSTSMTIDWRQGNTQLLQHGTAATSISHTAFYPGAQVKVIVCNPGTTAGAITWSGVDWVGGTVPSQTTTAHYCDIWSFIATTATSTTGATTKIFGAVTNGFQ